MIVQGNLTHSCSGGPAALDQRKRFPLVSARTRGGRVTRLGAALGHADHGKTAAAHYVGAAATVPALRVMAGGGVGG